MAKRTIVALDKTKAGRGHKMEGRAQSKRATASIKRKTRAKRR